MKLSKTQIIQGISLSPAARQNSRSHDREAAPGGSNREIIRWLRNGRPNPPPHSVKVRNILALADIFAIETLVETGTYRGDTIAATLERFTSIYSVEIEPRLAAAARARFHRVRGKVHLFEGDSTVLLPKIIVQLRGPPSSGWMGTTAAGALAGVPRIPRYLQKSTPSHRSERTAEM